MLFERLDLCQAPTMTLFAAEACTEERADELVRGGLTVWHERMMVSVPMKERLTLIMLSPSPAST